MARKVLDVFLSSTAKDLAEHRTAVQARLARSGQFHCIRQEDFGPQSATAIEVCRKKVLVADVFVGLIGQRRGWEPDGDASQRSITEMEYDWAKDAGRRRYVWILPDDFPLPANMRDTDAEHARQQAFRKRLMADGALVVSQTGFGSPELLAADITQHLFTVELLEALDERGDTAMAQSGGLEREIIVKLARRIKPDDALDFDQAIGELENAVSIALDAIAKGTRSGNRDEFVQAVLSRVAEQTKAGEFDHAAQEVDAGLAELDRQDEEHRATTQRSRIALLEAGIEQDILRRDAPAVARRVEHIAACMEPEDQTKRFTVLRLWQDNFYIEGRDKGLNFSLEIAIAIAGLTVGCTAETEQRGTALNDLGIALRGLGEREGGTTRLEEAVAAFRESLKESTRERVPLDWAMTQNNLGNALGILGMRESDTTRLEEAIAAFRAALKESPRERVPLDWAMTQNNLGNALQCVGERESGTALLEEAAAAYREALKERTRERGPLNWATTQNNLGNALQTLGARESGTARLDEAVAAFREALKERTRELVPLNWAATQNNLGVALSILGERERGTVRPEEAAAAYREALKERTRERVPLDWAMTQNNLGNALQILGERESGTVRLDEAVMAYREASKERTRERVPIDWAITQNNLGNALRRLGARESGTARLEEAITAYRAALEVFEPANASHYVEVARQNLARAEALLAERRRSSN